MRRASIGRHGLLAPVLLGVCLGACSGSGSSSGGGGPDLNEGSYTADDFGYTDPHPPAFQPFGNDSVILEPLEELAVFLRPGQGTGGTILDDRLAGSRAVADLGALLGGGRVVEAAAAGNVDTEGGAELVILTSQGLADLTIFLLKPENGQYAVVESFQAPFGDFQEVALADVDGDHRDEIVLTTLARLAVFDDREAGMGLLGQVNTPLTPARVRVLDADGDGRDEIALFFLGGQVHLYDDALAPGRFARIGSGSLGGSGDAFPLIGDFDGNGTEELAAVRGSIVIDLETRFEGTIQRITFDVATGLQPGSAQSLSLVLSEPFFPGFLPGPGSWGAAALDSDGDGTDEVAVVLPSEVGGEDHHDVLRIAWNGGWTAGAPSLVASWSDVESSQLGLCAADADVDGAEDLHVGLASGSAVQMRLVTWTPVFLSRALPAMSGSLGDRPLMVAGDFDADGMVLRSTGRKELGVADPIPLVLLSAAPTKAGIAQNYAATSTSYRVRSGTGDSIGVSTSTTVSATHELHTPLGEIFRVAASATVQSEFRRSGLDTRHTTFVRGFSAGFQEDVILFQGTLYRSYEYVVERARDPLLVGELITFDLPVDAKTFKWTVAKYDSTFGSERALAPLLDHRVGDPTSYLSRADVQALVDAHVGWMTPDGATVGATSGGSNALAIELASESTTSTERTFSLSAQAEFSTSFSASRISAGLSRSSIYSVTVSEATVYEGVVGDIAGPDWDPYHYDFGLAVYHHGVLAGSDNEPLPASEQPADTEPLQIVSFWTGALGSGY